MTLEKTYLIYKYTSPSGKAYIGQTKDIIKREKQHQKTKKCPAFKNAIDKYGFENFTREILEENLTLEEANIFEELYIEEYNTLSPNGYNLQTGGKNYIRSEETCKRISESGIGRTASNETKQLLSEIRTGEGHWAYHIPRELHPRYGIYGEINPASKKYIVTFPDGHEEFIIGLCEFCRNNNLLAGSMSTICNYVNRRTYKGFKCRHANAEDEALYLSPIE